MHAAENFLRAAQIEKGRSVRLPALQTALQVSLSLLGQPRDPQFQVNSGS